MANPGRVDGGGGRDAALGVARAAQGAPAGLAPSPERVVAPPDADARLVLDELFEQWARRERVTRPRSPKQLIADFVEPSITDMTPFMGGGALAILERVAAEIIPSLGDNDELRSLARAVINDEIGRHRELTRRRLSEIPL